MRRFLHQHHLRLILISAVILIFALALGWRQPGLSAQEIESKADMSAWTETMRGQFADSPAPANNPSVSATPCVGGFADIYPCNNVDLLSVMPHAAMGGSGGNDLWGWVDPTNGDEYAIVGQTNGTAFVDISDPENPVYIGRLPSHTGTSTWRDMKVYNDYVFIVSDGNGSHGMQVFDLTELPAVITPPVTFSETAHYPGVGSAHNVVINEDTGYAYIVGAGTCSGGLTFVDISNPLNPTDAGCFSQDGYTHDAQCVSYIGPDPDYAGAEICFNANEDTLTIADVTNKAAPVQVARMPYTGASYSHQGWVSEDHTYFMLGDELDESNNGHNTTTYLWDLTDLDNPVNFANYVGPVPAIDHNLYIHEGIAYESNYASGTRILDISDIANGNTPEIAFFDTYPPNDNTSFSGQWSNYPYFPSGVLIANDRGNGLFVLQVALEPDFSMAADDRTLEICADGSDSTLIDLLDRNGYQGSVTLSESGLPAGASESFTPNPVVVPGSSTLEVTTNGVSGGSYPFIVNGDDGNISHDLSMTLNVYDGAATVSLDSPPDGAVNVSLAPTFTWNGTGTSYTIDIATDAGFTNIVESATVAGTSYTSGGLSPDSTYYWRVSADNICGGNVSETWSFSTGDGSLLCNGPAATFESGLPTDWTVQVTTGSVYWSTTDDLAACDNGGNQTLGSGEAACADSDQTNVPGDPYDTELWTNSFDLTGYTDVSLEFAGAYNDIGTADLFEVWVWDGSSWTMEAQWDADFNEIVTLDLSAYGGLSDVAVSFRYSGLGWDWWAQVDDVTLDCSAGAGPHINVDPLFIGSTQDTNTVTNHPLDIQNVGTADLDWFIEEDNSATPAAGSWSDNFDSYATGSQMHGQGDWKGWFNDPAAGALTSDVQARSAPNSVDIVGASDLVHEYAGATSGQWTYTAWQYVPGQMTGVSYFIMLNQYDDAGATNNWSVQVNFDSTTGLVTSENDGAQLPMITNQWVELRVEIDLDADTQTFYYDGQELYTKSWSEGVSGGGITAIGAVDLFANNASSVYYDDMSLTEFNPQPDVCDVASDITWASVAPDNGTTAAGDTTTVDVTFNATGLLAGTYTGALCVHSNDPDPGSGNGTELVIVDLEMVVETPTDVSLSGITGETSTAVLPMLLAMTLALVVGFGLILRRRSVTE